MNSFTLKAQPFEASTFAANPVSVTAALKTSEILSKNKNHIYPKVSKTCDRIVNGIKDIANDKEIKITINSIGSMFQIFFTDKLVKSYYDVKASNIIKFNELFKSLLYNTRIFIPPSQYETCFISIDHNEEDIEKTIEAYEQALTKVKSI